MESIFSGFVIDPTKCNELSLKEKRELVYEISRWAHNAPEILQSWSRRELLELICAELGKERKYTGVTKPKMIDHLLKLISQKNEKLKEDKEQPEQVTYSVNFDSPLCKEQQVGALICKNVACRATLSAGDGYCKRCSCCICYKYDDNKDPSLWLVCSSDHPYCGNSCGMSCHLKCALKNKKAGILKNGCSSNLDSIFYCICCGKINWLMRSLWKQLAVAREARRVDVLCDRLSLSHKMLKGSEHYRELANIISSAVKILEREVGGALDQVSAVTARGIVNRLTCGAEVQKLCSSALATVNSILDSTSGLKNNNDPKPPGSQHFQILFEEITPFSMVVVLTYPDYIFEKNIDGCKVWHRCADTFDYPVEPTCHTLRPNTKNMVSGLSPSTEYFFKVSPFGSTMEFSEWEVKCSTRSLDQGSGQSSTQNSESTYIEEENLMQPQKKELDSQKQTRGVQSDSPKGSTNSSENNAAHKRGSKRAKVLRSEGASDNDESQLLPTSEVIPFANSNSSPSEAPRKPDWLSSTLDSACKKDSAEQQYEYCVKVIRWLECEGHMDKDFRVKFLTWFSLKATSQERRIVSAFIDVLISDPASLVAQLIDAFHECICNKEKPAAWEGMRKRLWH